SLEHNAAYIRPSPKGALMLRAVLRHLLLAALPALVLGYGSAAQNALAQNAPPANRVVMQVSDGDPAKWNLALNNAHNLQSDLGAKNVAIEIVAYGPGIEMLKADSLVGNRI